MADLYDDREEDVPLARRLRLSIRVSNFSQTELYGAPEVQLSIGAFIGDRPLFAPAVYGSGAPNYDWIAPGHFYGEDDGYEILFGLRSLLRDGEEFDVTATPDPFFRLVIAGDVFRPSTPEKTMKETSFDVLLIVQHGGAWAGVAMGYAGPAMMLSVTRQALETFYSDLLAEALACEWHDTMSKDWLRKEFGI